MNRKIITFVSVLFVFLLMFAGVKSINAKPTERVFQCSEGSLDPCDVIPKSNIQYFSGAALDWALRAPQPWVSYQASPTIPIYKAVFQGEDIAINLGLPIKVLFPLNEHVGIPQFGFANQKGSIVRYIPVKADGTGVNNMDQLWVTTFAEPVIEPYTQMLGNTYTTYWWAKTGELLLVYEWELSQEDNQLVIELREVTVEWLAIQNRNESEPVLADPNIAVLPSTLPLYRGESLEVLNIYETSVSWSNPAISNWYVQYRYVAYVEVQPKQGTPFILATIDREGTAEDTDVTNGCGNAYRPYVGETLYVTLERNYVDLIPHYPARELSAEEKTEFQERLDTESVTVLDGTIISERGAGQEYYFTLQKEDGTQAKFQMWEWGTPPVGTRVTVYTLDSRHVIGVQEKPTEKWWFIEVREAHWNQCE